MGASAWPGSADRAVGGEEGELSVPPSHRPPPSRPRTWSFSLGEPRFFRERAALQGRHGGRVPGFLSPFLTGLRGPQGNLKCRALPARGCAHLWEWPSTRTGLCPAPIPPLLFCSPAPPSPPTAPALPPSLLPCPPASSHGSATTCQSLATLAVIKAVPSAVISSCRVSRGHIVHPGGSTSGGGDDLGTHIPGSGPLPRAAQGRAHQSRGDTSPRHSPAGSDPAPRPFDRRKRSWSAELSEGLADWSGLRRGDALGDPRRHSEGLPTEQARA